MSTTFTKLTLSGREILSSYANFTLEGEMSSKITRGKDSYTLTTRNGIAKGTSDGENEAIYIDNEKALQSIKKNIFPLLPKKVVIKNGKDILKAVSDFDLKLVTKAGPNKRTWGGNATLAASTTFFQLLLQGSDLKAWEVLMPKNKIKKFYFPNIAFNMVCGGAHVPGTKQDIQEMFFFSMKDKTIKEVFQTATSFFRQFEKNLVRDDLTTGTAKERGFVFKVADNFEGLKRIKEVASQLGLKDNEWAIGTDNAFSELQKDDSLQKEGKYDMAFSGRGIITREDLVKFDQEIVSYASNFVTMEDPGSERDITAHRMMNASYGNRVQIVLDDAAVTQMRFIIPFLAAKKMEDRAGNSVLIKLNQAGTFTETRLATEIVLGLSDPEEVTKFLKARNDLDEVLEELKLVGVKSIEEALNNIKNNGFTAFFSHRSTEGSSEFLPYMPLIYGAVTPKIWMKAGAPNGERNLQNYNPLIRAEQELKAAKIKTEVANVKGFPKGVKVPAFN